MTDDTSGRMKATLGLTAFISSAMSPIAPDAFLWLTFLIQATTGLAGTGVP